MLKIYKVLDDNSETVGIEIVINGNWYFLAKSALFFNSIRAGKFPCDSDGREFERQELFSCEDW
jgi:hypothetical protein